MTSVSAPRTRWSACTLTDGDTPALRLEQDGSSGFAPADLGRGGQRDQLLRPGRDQRLDPAVPDLPGSSSNSLIIKNGNVGVGATSPDSSLHVRRTDGTAALHVEEASTTTAGRDLMTLTNNGGVRFLMNNTDLGLEWTFRTVGSGHFIINTTGATTNQFDLDDASGDLTIGGSLTELSSRAAKTDIEEIDPLTILQQLSQMDIPVWSYTHDPNGTRHLGPMAEDFWAAFGLGRDDKHIALTDKAGVALAAIKGLDRKAQTTEQQIAELKQVVSEKDQKIETLEQRLEALEKRIAAQEGDR